MFTTNLIIAHHVQNRDGLYTTLSKNCQKYRCNIDVGAEEARKELYYICLESDDYCFEIVDNADIKGMGLFLSFDDDASQSIPRIPLTACFYILERIIEVTQKFSSSVDVYITSSRATMLDYQSVIVKTSEIRETLKCFYDKEANIENIEPDVHLIIQKS